MRIQQQFLNSFKSLSFFFPPNLIVKTFQCYSVIVINFYLCFFDNNKITHLTETMKKSCLQLIAKTQE